MISILNNGEVLNEVYFGKKPLEHIEKQLDIVIQKFKSKPYSLAMNTDKDLLKFNRMMEKQFGFETFSLKVDPDPNLNAYAFPIGTSMSKADRIKLYNTVKAGKTGFLYTKDSHAHAYTCVTYGTIQSDFVTTPMIMAVLLHEIGHTYFESVMDKESVFTMNRLLLNALKKINKMASERAASGEKTTEVDIISDLAKVRIPTLTDIKNTIMKPFAAISRFILKFKKKNGSEDSTNEAFADNMTRRMVSYTNEKFADTFAAMYGYGPDLHKWLSEIYNVYFKQYGIKQSQNGFMRIYYIFSMNLNDLIAYMLGIKDEHPDGLARVKTSVDYYKKELAKESLDPKAKAELMEILKDTEQIIDDYINFPKDQDNMYLLRQYYIYLYKKFGGDRREKDADNSAIFNKIDKRYEEMKNS